MTFESKKTKLNIQYILLTFTMIAIFMLITVVAFALITGGEWNDKLHIVIPGAIGGAVGSSVAARRVILEVTGVSNPDRFEEMLIEHVNDKYTEQAGSGDHRVFEPRGGTYRLFNSWGGQELLKIKREGSDFTIEGPRKYMDLLEAYVGHNKQIKETH